MDRWEQKNKVIKAFDTLIQEVEIYFNIWKKQGGGTTEEGGPADGGQFRKYRNNNARHGMDGR